MLLRQRSSDSCFPQRVVWKTLQVARCVRCPLKLPTSENLCRSCNSSKSIEFALDKPAEALMSPRKTTLNWRAECTMCSRRRAVGGQDSESARWQSDSGGLPGSPGSNLDVLHLTVLLFLFILSSFVSLPQFLNLSFSSLRLPFILSSPATRPSAVLSGPVTS